MAQGEIDTQPLEQRIGYQFTDKALLIRSLTHPSYAKSVPDGSHYQRLEFLGDAVLGLVLAETLFQQLPEVREGPLTRYRSMLVKRARGWHRLPGPAGGGRGGPGRPRAPLDH